MFFVMITLAIFFSMNMGGASFAASFAAAYGGKILSRKKSAILFVIFVILGSLIFGQGVALTLGNKIIPSNFITTKALIIIFFSAGISMFVANLMKIPQSTSLVTVASIAGVGVFYKQLILKTILFLIPFWIGLPIASYLLTYYLTGYFYPPRKKNYWVYEKFINHKEKLKVFVVIMSCYNAFSVGTNNVANVVGPLLSVTNLSMLNALFIFALVYGLGGFVFSGPIKTMGNKIVPLGLLTASIVSFVSGSLMIFASAFSVPQSFVMLKMGAVFAVASLKDGHQATFKNPVTLKTFYTWTINPILTFIFSYGLALIFLK
jgi:sulfate permease